ncbi:MAG: ribbon-helix-helix protein, CopG family [Actinobacteria bacterium]|nr:ribbon-helix-helix protein, CopG family [Actinomycetota bacterium]
MTTQIAVRLPDDIVLQLDALVADGSAPSRASIVERALRRELRRFLAERDLRILDDSGDDPGLAAVSAWAANQFTLDDG